MSSLAKILHVSAKDQENAGTQFDDIFALDQISGSADLGAELDSALSQIFSESGDVQFLENLSVDEELAFLEFAAIEEGRLRLDLNDVIAAAEIYPGLKITFSF